MNPIFLYFLKLSLIIFIPFQGSTQTWLQIDDFPATERDDGVSFVIGNKAYCGTGYKAGWVETKDFYVLDMSTDEWSTIASLPSEEERQYASGFASETHGYVFGGIKEGNYLNDLWIYNFVLDSWIEKTSLPAEALNLAQENKEIALRIYPNPTNEKLFLEIKMFNPNITYKAIITNAIGEVIKRKTIQGQVTTFNIMDLPKGIYFINLKNRKGRNLMKFVKSK